MYHHHHYHLESCGLWFRLLLCFFRSLLSALPFLSPPEDAHAQGQLTRPPNQCPRTHIHKRKYNDLQTNAGARSCPQGQGNDLRTRAPGRSCAKKTETTVKTISEDAHAQTERKPYRGTLQATQTTSKPMPKDAPAQRRPNDLQTNARGRSCAKNTETTSKPMPKDTHAQKERERASKPMPEDFHAQKIPKRSPKPRLPEGAHAQKVPGKGLTTLPPSSASKVGSHVMPVSCPRSQAQPDHQRESKPIRENKILPVFHRTFIPGESRWHGWNWHLTLQKQKRLCFPATVEIGEPARPWHFSQNLRSAALPLKFTLGFARCSSHPCQVRSEAYQWRRRWLGQHHDHLLELLQNADIYASYPPPFVGSVHCASKSSRTCGPCTGKISVLLDTEHHDRFALSQWIKNINILWLCDSQQSIMTYITQ